MTVEDILPVWWFLAFSLMVYVTVLIPRRIVERWKPAVRENWLWREIVLHSAGPVIGITYALLMKDYPMLVSTPTFWMRAALGCLAGFFSSYIYRVVMSALKAKTGIDLDPSSGD